MINKKKILVNSQITAMISMLESTSNVAFIIVIWYFKGTTYFSLLIPLTVYVVILPHAFLMNTSDNKNRIVEEGWKNVFKNIFRLSKKARVNIENRSNTAEPSSTSSNKIKIAENQLLRYPTTRLNRKM